MKGEGQGETESGRAGEDEKRILPKTDTLAPCHNSQKPSQSQSGALPRNAAEAVSPSPSPALCIVTGSGVVEGLSSYPFGSLDPSLDPSNPPFKRSRGSHKQCNQQQSKQEQQ